MRLSITSPLVPPSPNGRRVGIRIVTFEACSGFTRVTARRIAQPPKATFVTRLQPLRLPGRAARQLPDQSTTIRVESSSTGDSRLRGALPSADLWRIGAAAYGDQLALPVSDLNVDKSNGAALTAHAPGASDRFGFIVGTPPPTSMPMAKSPTTSMNEAIGPALEWPWRCPLEGTLSVHPPAPPVRGHSRAI